MGSDVYVNNVQGDAQDLWGTSWPISKGSPGAKQYEASGNSQRTRTQQQFMDQNSS